MPASTKTLFRRLQEGPSRDRQRAARDLLDRDLGWPTWTKLLNEAYLSEPERGVAAAAHLAVESERREDEESAARFAVLRGVGLQRTGSPHEAADVLLEAAARLQDVGDDEWATQARIVGVDALAHAGRIDEALALAGDTGRSLRGPRAPLWRAVLAANRANALRLRGDLDAALADYARAERAFRRHGQVPSAVATRMNAGVALLYGGDARGAARRFEYAEAAFEELGQTDRALEARYNLACAWVRGGSLGRGVSELDRLAASFASRGLTRREALCRMDLADALRRAGDRRAATEEAGHAAKGFAEERAYAEEIEALWIAAASGAPVDPRAARTAVERALRRAREIGRKEMTLRLELLRHELGAETDGRLDRANVRALRVRARRLGQQEVELEADLLLAEDALRQGRIASAERTLGSRRFSQPGRPWLRVAAQTLRARCEVARGNVSAAIRRLRGVAAWLDEVRGDLGGAWLRTTFLLDRLDPYLERVALLLERGRASDARRAEALLDALAARRFLEGGTPAGKDARLDALRRRLEAIYEQIASQERPSRHGEALDPRVAARQARDLEAQIAHRWRASERRVRPATAVELSRPSPATLPGDVLAVHLWPWRGRVCGLTRRGPAVGPVVDLGRTGDLEALGGRLRFHAHRAGRMHSPDAEDSVEALLEELSQRVLMPLRPADWPETVWLVVDPHVPDLPIEMLPVDEQPLVTTRTLLRTPSLRVAPPHARRGTGTALVALGEGNLPGVEEELKNLRRFGLPIRHEAATREAVLHALASRNVVHLSGHGFDAPDAPTVGGVRLADGWLTAADLPDRVAARVVVLAACRTGATPGLAGEAWGGLPQALLRSGARRVLWTAGDVDDATTAALMTAFHEERVQLGADRAFGRAVERVLDEGCSCATLLPFRISGIAS